MMLQRRRWMTGLIGLFCSFAFCGCGSSGPKIVLGTVTGVVTLDGTKLNAGRVIFFNKSGFSETANIKSDGTYEVKTAVGETDVFIDHREPPAKPPEGRVEMPMPGKSLVPDKYANSQTSGLKLTVTAGKNQFDIAMTK